MQVTWVQSLGWEGTLEKGKATHSSILAWRIPWTVCIVHAVTKSRTQLSDFHFLTFHSLWPRPQVNFDPSVPPTSYSICRESIGSGVIIYLESIGFSHHPSRNGSQPPPPLTLYTRSTQQLKGILCSMSDYDTQLLKPTPLPSLQWPLIIKPCNDLQGPP